MEHKLSAAQMQKFIAVVNEVERYRDLSEKEKEGIVLSIIGRPYMDLRSDWAFKHVLQDNRDSSRKRDLDKAADADKRREHRA